MQKAALTKLSVGVIYGRLKERDHDGPIHAIAALNIRIKRSIGLSMFLASRIATFVRPVASTNVR
jgi:hypothetical protein